MTFVEHRRDGQAAGTRRTPTRRLVALQIALAVLLFSLPCASLVADAFSERRAYVGLKLFRTLVAADLEIRKKVAGDGTLPIYLVYANSDSAALEYEQNLQASLPTVRDIPASVRVLPLADVLRDRPPRPAAVFIAQQLDDAELDRLIRHSIARQIILFSPFEGDVEKGVLAGLSVEATVRPLINMQTLNASQVAIKDFYLKVAKRYESK